jgi:hypothetical protein
MFKPSKRFRITVYLPILLYGREKLTIKAKAKPDITVAEMRFMRRTVTYIQIG